MQRANPSRRVTGSTWPEGSKKKGETGIKSRTAYVVCAQEWVRVSARKQVEIFVEGQRELWECERARKYAFSTCDSELTVQEVS